MQVFSPFSDVTEVAELLDNQRLNKQLLEGRQLLNINTSGKSKVAWINHPACKMVRGYDAWFFTYLEAMKDECNARGIKTDKNWDAILEIRETAPAWTDFGTPPWWGDGRVHLSHQANLYRKVPLYYAEFKDSPNDICCAKCLYYWPTHDVDAYDTISVGELTLTSQLEGAA